MRTGTVLFKLVIAPKNIGEFYNHNGLFTYVNATDRCIEVTGKVTMNKKANKALNGKRGERWNVLSVVLKILVWLFIQVIHLKRNVLYVGSSTLFQWKINTRKEGGGMKKSKKKVKKSDIKKAIVNKLVKEEGFNKKFLDKHFIVI